MTREELIILAKKIRFAVAESEEEMKLPKYSQLARIYLG